ncbi:MAG: M23 family metallopeptidase [Clostridia bacterium]|nr:M23 family metallopeptidase [Clostridia bacterium]
MSKQTKRTKEKRQGAPNQTGVKVAQFFKKNIYVILMIICILAIATMITLAVVLNNNNDSDTVLKPIVSGDNNPDDDKPPVVDPDDNKPNEPDDPDKDDKPSVTPPPEKEDFVMANPLDEFTLGQIYSEEHVFNPTHNYWHPHEGLDFVAAAGSNVKCVFDGTVKEVTNDSYSGATVTIEHQDGFTTVYKLLDEVSLKAGDKVSKGDVIGKVSNTALEEIADGAHLHLELYKDGVKINPMDYLLSGDK